MDDIGVALKWILLLKKKPEDTHESIVTRTEAVELEGLFKKGEGCFESVRNELLHLWEDVSVEVEV